MRKCGQPVSAQLVCYNLKSQGQVDKACPVQVTPKPQKDSVAVARRMSNNLYTATGFAGMKACMIVATYELVKSFLKYFDNYNLSSGF